MDNTVTKYYESNINFKLLKSYIDLFDNTNIQNYAVNSIKTQNEIENFKVLTISKKLCAIFLSHDFKTTLEKKNAKKYQQQQQN